MDDVLVVLVVIEQACAAYAAHDPVGQRLAEPERIADGDDEVPDFERGGIAERQRRQTGCLDLQQRDVRGLVAAQELPNPSASRVCRRILSSFAAEPDPT
jgi:hypothetical protein